MSGTAPLPDVVLLAFASVFCLAKRGAAGRRLVTGRLCSASRYTLSVVLRAGGCGLTIAAKLASVGERTTLAAVSSRRTVVGPPIAAAFGVAAAAEAGLAPALARLAAPPICDPHICATARRLELPSVPRTTRPRLPTDTAAAPRAEIVAVLFLARLDGWVVGRAVCGLRLGEALGGVLALTAGTWPSEDMAAAAIICVRFCLLFSAAFFMRLAPSGCGG